MLAFGGKAIGRWPALALVVAGLCLAPAAQGATRDYRGTFETGGTARFELTRKPHRVPKVVNWRWQKLPVTCGDTQGALSGEFYRPWIHVDPDRNFHQTATRNDGEGSAEVWGSFPGGWAAAEGTFQILGTTTVGKGCDTGRVAWTAKRVTGA